jgi:hypothetical protein
MNVKSIHESAHCIAAIILGVEFDKVTIEINAFKIINNDEQGESALITSPNVIFKNFNKLTKEQKVILALSGSVAEAILTKQRMDNFPNRNFQTEFTITDKAKEFLIKRNTEDYKLYTENTDSDKNFDEDINKTMTLINDNWEDVLLLAQHLEKNKIITYDEVKKIVNIKKSESI